MDGDDAGHRPLADQRSVRRRESGLPVVGVNELRTPRDRTRPRSEQRCGAREQAKAQRIVFPIGAAGILVGTAIAIIEHGTIDDPCRNVLRQLGFEQTRGGKPRDGVDTRRIARASQRS